ncbi:MAG: hypothetical protein SFU99_21695 [Saprospiraceae bacterium]|nr:hypothetical protein [Saprospiraceae bacterium]
MKTYDSYKPSGIEWIGEIPSHWEDVRIKQLAVGENTLFLDGDWIESTEIVFDENNIRYITTGNIGEGKYKEQGSGFITEETFKKLNCTEVFPGDLVISRLNPPIGRACIIPDLGKRIVTSVDNVILRPNDRYSKHFLVYFFSNSKYYEFTLLEGRGATMQRISRSILGNIKIVVPKSIEEQTTIAHYLDRKTAEIDALIADKKRLLDLYEEEKTALINQAVTKGLDPTVPMKDSGIEWLGEVPAHWEVSRMKNICSVRQGLQIPIEKRHLTQIENSFEYITIRSINNPDNPKEYIENPPKNVICDFADILMARTGATGEPIINVSGVFHNNFFLIDYDRKQVDRMFLYYFLKSSRIKEYLLLMAGTTTIPDLNHGDFYNTPFFKFEIQEQKAIVHYIETESSRVDTKIAKTKKLINLLTEYRTALISEVVTGKVKVV